MRMLQLVGSIVTLAGTPLAAMKTPREAWSSTRTVDPITGQSSCVVAAYDKIGRMEFSRFGYLYPVVENNSRLGLLVGVSSGGRFRVPTGNILWRIDANPYRELKAADNPFDASSTLPTAPYKTGNESADKAVADAMALTQKLTVGMTATSTVATGPKAQEMLREMLGGHALIFRQAQAAPTYGLPSSAMNRVGQYTDDGLKPIPLDDSFRRGLAECGIPTV